MFGYVKTYTPELKVAEYEYYRGAYCGLCRSMGKCTGQCSRMTLSYDFAFLALIRLALSKEQVSFSKRRCIAHPLRKRNMMERNPQLDYCSYAAAILTYHKLADDLCDEKGRKRAVALLTRPLAKKMRKRALKKEELYRLDDLVSEKLSELSEFEKSGEIGVDAPADIFGAILAEIVSSGFEGGEKRIAENLGFHLGRWIYITDALDDLPEDVKRGRYNPFSLTYGEEMGERERLIVADALKNELFDAEGALDLIDFGDDLRLKNIVYNAFYLGMPKTVESVISKDRCDKCNSSKDNCNRKDNLNSDE